MEKEEFDEIAKIDTEIHKLEIMQETIYYQLKKLKERRTFLKLLP